ncbi:hypothetical protein ACJMK2_028446 [Sinanodonta woodiana]|uniref:RING-type domain-containing protein n=1 Tax=Sinanodonta woodiana TaxID=1069815 RepID=A0ABD3XB43_SINWO
MVCYCNGSPNRCWCKFHSCHGRFAAAWFYLSFAKWMLIPEANGDARRKFKVLQEKKFSVEVVTEKFTTKVSSNRVLQDLTGKADSVNVIAKAKTFAPWSIKDFMKTTVVAMHQADVESFRVEYPVIRNEEKNGSYDDRVPSNDLVKEKYFDDCIKTGGHSFIRGTCNSVAHTNEDRECDFSNYQDIHKKRKQQNESSKILKLIKMKKQHCLKTEEFDSRDKTLSTTLSEEWFKKNPDSDISRSFKETSLSEEKVQVETHFHEDRKLSKSQPVSVIQQEYTPLTSTDESLLQATEVRFNDSSQKCEDIYDKDSDSCLVITKRPSDFISLKYEKKNFKKALWSKLHYAIIDNYFHFVSRKNSKKTTDVKIPLKKAVKVLSLTKQVISSSVRDFFETDDTGLNQIKDSNEPETRTPLGIDVAVQKEKLGVDIDVIMGTDIDLQKKKKHHLRQIIRFPRNCLPLPRLSRDAIVGFLEEQTCDGHGGSTLPPSEHEDLREMLRLLASANVPGPQITMKYEMLRLCTMKSFPGRDRPFAIRIVGAGFYYAGHKDQVVCYCCGNRKDSWVIGDIPLLIHQNMAPDCGFLTHNAQFNVPIRKANSSESPSPAEVRLLAVQRFYGSNPSDTAHSESSLMLTSSEQNRWHNVSDNLPTVSANVDSVLESPPKYPQYAVQNMRINSFQRWPAELQQRPEEMAECGFYYAGFNDCVRCFHCGVGLRHWMNEDDPWIEHARWSTSCVYVLKMKGEEFVSLVKMAVEIAEREEEARSGANQAPEDRCETTPAVTANDASSNSNTADSVAVKDASASTGVAIGNATGAAASTPSHGNTEIQKYLLTDAAQSVLDMGYQPKLVQRAIERVLLNKGQIILEAVFEIEEETVVQPQHQQAAQSAEGHESIGKGSEATENTSPEESQLDLEKIKTEHRELRDAKLCKICMENTICVVFLPCAHLVTCSDCAPAMRKCPICRTLIKGTVKTFYG